MTCYVKPLKVKEIKGKTAILETNIKAYYDKKVGKIKVGDYVLVYGNLVIERINTHEKTK